MESNRQNLVRREQAWLRRGAKARSTKQKARIQRAEAVIAVQAPREAGKVKLESAALASAVVHAGLVSVIPHAWST